jgi:hypothetical protein
VEGVGELLEAGDLAVGETPDVDELGVLGAACGLVGAGVAAQDDDGVAGVEELMGRGGEVVPLAGAAGEDAGGDGLGPDVGVAVGVGEVVGLGPGDVVAEAAQDSREVAGGEGLLDGADGVEVGIGHGVLRGERCG